MKRKLLWLRNVNSGKKGTESKKTQVYLMVPDGTPVGVLNVVLHKDDEN